MGLWPVIGPPLGSPFHLHPPSVDGGRRALRSERDMESDGGQPLDHPHLEEGQRRKQSQPGLTTEIDAELQFQQDLSGSQYATQNASWMR